VAAAGAASREQRAAGRITLKRLFALVLALPFLLLNAGPTAASQVIVDEGSHGPYSFDDTMASPGGTCTYGDVVYANWAYLKQIQVNPPHVFAADRHASRRDHRAVSWQVLLQRKHYEATKWHTIKRSSIQRATAYDNQEAAFSAITVRYNSEKEDLDHNSSESIVYRAKVVIKWYRRDGSLEAVVKLAPDWYTTDTYWAASPSSAECSRINTDG
jgi:hypothetical protein